jgi:hypothetical protein
MELYFNSPNTPSWRGAQAKISTGIALPLPLTCSLNNIETIDYRYTFVHCQIFELISIAHFFRKISVSWYNVPYFSWLLRAVGK